MKKEQKDNTALFLSFRTEMKSGDLPRQARDRLSKEDLMCHEGNLPVSSLTG
jgi:hypothetical protein